MSHKAALPLLTCRAVDKPIDGASASLSVINTDHMTSMLLLVLKFHGST